MLRNESELESGLAELDSLLEMIGGQSDDRLAALARKISEQSHGLMDAHDVFESEFNRLAADRGVQDDALTQLVADYDTNRLQLRNEFLRTQDELHQAVPKDAWPDVLEALNRKQQARVPGRAREG
jgi:hypothetical protein